MQPQPSQTKDQQYTFGNDVLRCGLRNVQRLWLVLYLTARTRRSYARAGSFFCGSQNLALNVYGTPATWVAINEPLLNIIMKTYFIKCMRYNNNCRKTFGLVRLGFSLLMDVRKNRKLRMQADVHMFNKYTYKYYATEMNIHAHMHVVNQSIS